MAYNKIIYGGAVLIDLTSDTVTADALASGVTAHDKSGAIIVGTSTYDVDSTDATVTAAEILAEKTAYARGVKLIGTMTNNGAVAGIISGKTQKYTVPQGYHDGSGTVQIDADEQAKLIAANIRQGVTILGVEGTMSSSEGVVAQSKEVTPSTAAQVVLPDDGYTHLSQVTVLAIPYVESDNSAGGVTVTIG